MTTFAIPFSDLASIFGAGDRSVSRVVSPWLEPGALSNSVSIDDARRESVQSLLMAVGEAVEWNWDGDGGTAVAPETLSHSLVLLESLPTTVAPPEISVHPDGQIGLFWTRGRRNTVAVAVSQTGLVSFASLHGHRRLHGSEYLLNGLPSSLALVLRQHFSGDS